jgi:hypothetical protein
MKAAEARSRRALSESAAAGGAEAPGGELKSIGTVGKERRRREELPTDAEE